MGFSALDSIMRRLSFILLVSGLVAGCATQQQKQATSVPDVSWLSRFSFFKPYSLDIQQGVVVDSAMVQHLRPGMTQVQVGALLGTPLLSDPFHANRWDYVFYTRKDGHLSEPHDLTLYFKGGKLLKFDSNYPGMPDSFGVQAQAGATAASPAPTVPAAGTVSTPVGPAEPAPVPAPVGGGQAPAPAGGH